MTWLLPTKDNVAGLRRFLNAARETATSTPGLVLVNSDDFDKNREEYAKAEKLMPPGWRYHIVDASCLGDAVRAAWPLVKDLPWVGLVCDDQVPATSCWDTALLQSLAGWNIVSSNDGWQAPNRIHGAILWSGDLLRAVGWMFPPGLRHIFQDNIWEELGRETAAWSVRMDVMVRHLHAALEAGYVAGPTMDPSSELWIHDQHVYQRWQIEEKPAHLAAIEALKARYGVSALKADFAAVKLLVGTPSMSGDYDSFYMQSFFALAEMMRSAGVTLQLAEQKYTADICLARANIFSAFVRSDCTHLLMIDADMGWANEAVIRLFAAGKDYVAIAGPKKRYPLQFAANATDDEGNPLPLVFDQSTGTMKVGEIGAAFTLITRAMAERMVAAYRAEFEFDGIGGQPEWAIFTPFVRGRRYYSEDFAFCRRWRDIGGEVFLVPDVKLKHTGKHTFEGSFAQTLPPAVPVPLADAAD